MRVFNLIIVIIIFCCGCSKDRETPSGYKVNVLREGEGEVVKTGEFLITKMVIKNSKDSIWRNTWNEGYPMIIPIQVLPPGKDERDIEAAFRLLKKNDSVMCKTTAVTFFEGQALPPNVKPDEVVTFIVSVTEIANQERIQQIQSELQAKQQLEIEKMTAAQLSQDTIAIDTYLTEKNIKGVIRDKSGMRIVIVKAGKGPKPTLENTIVFNYKGTFLNNGEIFDQSRKGEPAQYPLTQLIKGWQIAFPTFAKGTKAILYVPSSLGYGAGGYPPGIPGNANLIFEVELVDFF